MAQRVLLTTVLLVCALTIPTVVWAWYATTLNRTVVDWRGLKLLSTATPTRLLVISTISSTMSKLMVGPVMAMYAYVGSTEWLAGSASGQLSKLPTTTQ